MKASKLFSPLLVGLLMGWFLCQPAPVFAVVATGAGGGTTLTDSASLRSALSDETGTGVAVFDTSPTFTTGMTSATAATTGGATLADGTYYYACTAITPNGEYNSGSNEVNVTVSGADNSVNLVTFGTTSRYKKRIYRGTTTGVYDGYFELAENTGSLADIGQAFTAYSPIPAAGQHDITCVEPDANYAVIVTPSWLTTFRVTSKATTGFTIDFGTAAPAGATVDWFMVR